MVLDAGIQRRQHIMDLKGGNVVGQVGKYEIVWSAAEECVQVDWQFLVYLTCACLRGSLYQWVVVDCDI